MVQLSLLPSRFCSKYGKTFSFWLLASGFFTALQERLLDGFHFRAELKRLCPSKSLSLSKAMSLTSKTDQEKASQWIPLWRRAAWWSCAPWGPFCCPRPDHVTSELDQKKMIRFSRFHIWLIFWREVIDPIFILENEHFISPTPFPFAVNHCFILPFVHKYLINFYKIIFVYFFLFCKRIK